MPGPNDRAKAFEHRFVLLQRLGHLSRSDPRVRVKTLSLQL